MNRDEIAWAIARSAFADDMARVENNISEFAGRLMGAGVSHINEAARNYAPDMLRVIRERKIERAIARREWRAGLPNPDLLIRVMTPSQQDMAVKEVLSLPFDEAFPIIRYAINHKLDLIWRADISAWCVRHAKTIVALANSGE